MQKTGQVDRTVDREFAEEEGRYRTYVSSRQRGWRKVMLTVSMEKETNNLQKEAKTYLDSMRGQFGHHIKFGCR